MNSQSDNNKKFHAAVNALTEKWCGVSDAFSLEQASDMLSEQVSRGAGADIVTARMCALAYGMANITLRDAALLADDELRRGLRAGTEKLKDKAEKTPTIADALDILLRHWRDLSDSEKRIVADVVVGAWQNDAGTAA